jgi:hypothetical protein
LALISYVGCNDTRSAADQQALRQALNRVAPELGAVWPAYHDLDEMLAGAAARRGNVSAVWAWLAGHDVAREYAAGLFDEAEAALVPVLLEHDAAELNALLATMSFWARLSATQREALIAENTDLFQRLGRPIRSSTVACLVTAQRAADA